MADQDERSTTITEFVGACLERHGPPDRPPPIVLLVGRRGTGKTALLDRLQDQTLAEPRPCARLDVSQPGADSDPDPDPVAILTGLMSQLHPRVQYVGAIPFPRFGLGLIALDLNPADKLSLRRSELGATLRAHDGASLVAQLQPVLADLTLYLPPDSRPPLEIATWVAGGLIPFIRHRRTGKLLDWYAGRDVAAGGAGQDTLYRLSEWRAKAETAWRVEKTLCAAFLADLGAHFDERRLSRPWRPVSNCLVLLDNTGGSEATRFLETLAECRAEMPRTGDPLVVVAGHHLRPDVFLMAGRPAKTTVTVRGPTDATIRGPDHQRWREETRNWPDPTLWYPVGLADLDGHGMQLMVPSRVLDGKRGHDADFIHALTGGHLGMTATFAAALVIRHRRTGKLLDWYAGRDAAAGGAGADTLYRLSEWRAKAETAWRVEKTLCAAFLADLGAHFDERRLSRPWRPVSNCLVLLDNTGGSEATRFLETLAECRAEMPRTGDPLVVVAGHHLRPDVFLMAGRPAKTTVTVRGPTDATIRGPDHQRWREETRNWPDPTLWYPVGLADLDGHGMQLMVPSRVLDGKRGHDADFIHALTGGHLGMTATFAAALVSTDVEADPVDPRELCREHDRLIRRLLPADLDDTTLNAMAVCAATPGLRLAACTAVSRSLPEAKVHAQEVRDLLTATMWADEQANGDLDLHPLPRRLLLLRLADDPAWWKRVHEVFQDHYRAVGNDSAVRYHTLACEEPGTPGELARLTGHMDARLGELAAAKWCDELDRLTVAPNRLRTNNDPWDVVTDLAGAAPDEGLDRRKTIARIIVAEWLHHDRIFDPRHKLAGLLAREYLNLAACVKPHGEVFVRRAEQSGHIARDWGWTP